MFEDVFAIVSGAGMADVESTMLDARESDEGSQARDEQWREDGEAALHKADVVIAEVERLPLLGAELAVLCDQCKIKDEFRAFLAKFNVQTVAQFASITDDGKNLKTDVFDV